MSEALLNHLSVADIRHELRGFPDPAVEAVIALKTAPTTELLQRAIMEILAFYLPSGANTDLTTQATSARLREDLGVDSLTFAEAAFKMEGLFAVRIENAELVDIQTIGQLREFTEAKLLVAS